MARGKDSIACSDFRTHVLQLRSDVIFLRSINTSRGCLLERSEKEMSFGRPFTGVHYTDRAGICFLFCFLAALGLHYCPWNFSRCRVVGATL